MCGVVGIVSTRPVAQSLYNALTVLQHRGQDAAGIATLDGQKISLHKDNGLLRDVFLPEVLLAEDAMNAVPDALREKAEQLRHDLVEAAVETGILTDFPKVVPPEDAAHLPRENLMLLVSGSQGERRAASALPPTANIDRPHFVRVRA